MSEVDDCSWCYTGDEIESELEVVEEENERKKKNRIQRFWLPVNPTREIQVTFVDDTLSMGHKPALAIYEHQMLLNGHYRNWFTCLGKGKCPLCKAGNNAYYAGVFTVIDHSEWEDKKGEVHKDVPKLFVAKTGPLRIVQRISTKREGLRGAVLGVCRVEKKHPSVGSSFDFEKKVSLSSDVQPFDYKEIFKPQSAEALMKIVGTIMEEEAAIKF